MGGRGRDGPEVDGRRRRRGQHARLVGGDAQRPQRLGVAQVDVAGPAVEAVALHREHGQPPRHQAHAAHGDADHLVARGRLPQRLEHGAAVGGAQLPGRGAEQHRLVRLLVGERSAPAAGALRVDRGGVGDVAQRGAGGPARPGGPGGRGQGGGALWHGGGKGDGRRLGLLGRGAGDGVGVVRGGRDAVARVRRPGRAPGGGDRRQRRPARARVVDGRAVGRGDAVAVLGGNGREGHRGRVGREARPRDAGRGGRHRGRFRCDGRAPVARDRGHHAREARGAGTARRASGGRRWEAPACLRCGRRARRSASPRRRCRCPGSCAPAGWAPRRRASAAGSTTAARRGGTAA